MSSFFDEQKTQMQARLAELDDRIKQAQATLAELQGERRDIVQRFSDLKAAFQAWKGQPL